MADFRSAICTGPKKFFETYKSRKEENGTEEEPLLQMEYTKRPDVRIGKNRFIADIILLRKSLAIFPECIIAIIKQLKKERIGT